MFYTSDCYVFIQNMDLLLGKECQSFDSFDRRCLTFLAEKEEKAIPHKQGENGSKTETEKKDSNFSRKKAQMNRRRAGTKYLRIFKKGWTGEYVHNLPPFLCSPCHFAKSFAFEAKLEVGKRIMIFTLYLRYHNTYQSCIFLQKKGHKYDDVLLTRLQKKRDSSKRWYRQFYNILHNLIFLYQHQLFYMSA